MSEQYKVKLTKVKSTNTNLRTDTVEGVTNSLPEVGKVVRIFGEGLEFGTRVVTTSTVQSVEKISNEYVFNTLNSTYKLEILEVLTDTKE